MNSPLSQSAREAVPRRLIVTASVAIFAVCDWNLQVLLRDGPWDHRCVLCQATKR